MRERERETETDITAHSVVPETSDHLASIREKAIDRVMGRRRYPEITVYIVAAGMSEHLVSVWDIVHSVAPDILTTQYNYLNNKW